jgi:hypothetical protein
VLPLPDVPAVDPAPPDALVDPAPVDPVLLVEPVDPAPPDALLAPEPMRALVSMYMPLREVEADAVGELLPVVPLVPVAPDAPPPPCRQPVTVIVRLLLDVLPV